MEMELDDEKSTGGSTTGPISAPTVPRIWRAIPWTAELLRGHCDSKRSMFAVIKAVEVSDLRMLHAQWADEGLLDPVWPDNEVKAAFEKLGPSPFATVPVTSAEPATASTTFSGSSPLSSSQDSGASNALKRRRDDDQQKHADASAIKKSKPDGKTSPTSHTPEPQSDTGDIQHNQVQQASVSLPSSSAGLTSANSSRTSGRTSTAIHQVFYKLKPAN